MTIKHLVISGGGHSIFRTIGALNYLEDNGYWKTSNIESIYGTSAGAIFGAIICLQFDHITVENYLLNRPWHDAFCIKVDQLISAYSKKGVFDHTAIEIIFKPLLNAKDLSLTLTMKDLYEFSKIELHVFTLEVNDFETVDISYKTHPDLPLLSALVMTSAIPGIFAPFCDDQGCCFIDGGVIANYPLKWCVDAGCKLDEILGITFNYDKEKEEKEGHNVLVTKDSNLLDFFLTFFGKLVRKVGTENSQPMIPNEISCDATYMSYESMTSALSSVGNRKLLFEEGIASAKMFLEHRVQKFNHVLF
jgi:predicted acylesterase/phospholipase RssA